MPLEYEHLSAEDRKAIADQHRADTDPAGDPVVDDAILAAWEREHYAHSLLAEQATDDDERQEHLDAMATIEDAVTRHRRPAR